MGIFANRTTMMAHQSRVATRLQKAVIRLTIIVLAVTIYLSPKILSAHPTISGGSITITEASNASTIDVGVGTIINVYLKVAPSGIYNKECLWSDITMSGDAALQETPKKVLLPTGVTADSFRAVRSGAAQLDSFRYDCLRGARTEWHVNVQVIEAHTSRPTR
jgi:hypothetical protein